MRYIKNYKIIIIIIKLFTFFLSHKKFLKITNTIKASIDPSQSQKIGQNGQIAIKSLLYS